MILRACVVVAICCWCVCVRSIIFYYLLEGGDDDPQGPAFDWWVSWVLALPVTGISVLIPTMMIAFIIHG